VITVTADALDFVINCVISDLPARRVASARLHPQRLATSRPLAPSDPGHTIRPEIREGVLGRIIALQTEVAIRRSTKGCPPWMTDSIAALAESGLVPSGLSPVSLDQRFALVELALVAVRRADSAL
jgi:hypothetical protein